MQIKSSQNNFPPQQTYVSENVGTGDYKVWSTMNLLEIDWFFTYYMK